MHPCVESCYGPPPAAKYHGPVRLTRVTYCSCFVVVSTSDSILSLPLLFSRYVHSLPLSQLFLALTLHVIYTFFLSFLPYSTAQALVDEKEEHQAGLPEDNVRRPATESLVHTKLIAEGLFDVSRSSGGRGTGTSPFDLFAAKMPRVEGRSPNDPKRAPDAFDVRACC